MQIFKVFNKVSGIAENVSHKGVTADARGLKYIACDAVEFDTVRIEGFKGSASLGTGESPSIFVDCIFQSCHFTQMNFGYSTIRRCRFLDCTIDDLVTFEADVLECEFTGVIRRAIFSAKPEFMRIRTQEVAISENDFSGCKLIDVAFRGGIEITAQKFSESDRWGVLTNIQFRIDEFLRRSDGLNIDESKLKAINWLRQYSEKYGQRDIFVSSTFFSSSDSSSWQLIENLRQIEA